MAYAHVRVGGEGGSLLLLPKSLPLFSPSLFVSFPILLGISRTFFGKVGRGRRRKDGGRMCGRPLPSFLCPFKVLLRAGAGFDKARHTVRVAKGRDTFFTFLVSALLSSHGRISLQVGFPLPRGLPPPAFSSSSSLSCSEGPNKSSSSLLPSPPL